MSGLNGSQPRSSEAERCKILAEPTSTTDQCTTSTPSCSKRKSSPNQNEASRSQTEDGHFAYYNSTFDSSEITSSPLDNGLTSSKEHNGLENGKGLNSSFYKYVDGQEINIRRPPVNTFTAESQYGLLPTENISEKVKRSVRSRCSCNLSCILSFITSLFPILSWAPKYHLQYLLPDIISGFTISILHIPQGMAYGLLASLKPENGLYVSFFPVMIYFILGTSRHISIGTFAVVSLLVSGAVDKSHTVRFRDPNFNATQSNTTTGYSVTTLPPTHLEMATTLCILVGFWQLLMGVFRLGSLSVVLSDQLVSGFSTGAAIHVATSQLADLFGIKLGKHGGLFKIIFTYEEIFQRIRYSNVATVIVSAVAILTLAIVKEQVNERFKNKLKMQIPIDLAVVVLATTISYFVDFHDTYKVAVMKEIPIGLPSPSPPLFHLVSQLLMDSVVIAIVSFAISLSMAKIFSKKHRYEINASQELIALGCANVFSSFFSCYPCSASLSRSLVQERSGGKTQFASIISCGILLLVLLVLAPLFYSLPRCILSAVILVALKGMFLQMMDFFKAWKVSKLDASIWLMTFLTTVFLDVSMGLLCGVIFALFTVILRTVVPSKALLGNVVGTDLYLDIQRFREAKEVRGVKIFRFQSALYFMNTEYFKNCLYRMVPITDRTEETVVYIKDQDDSVHHLIIDCSSFSYIDMTGMETLLEIMKEYLELNVVVFLSDCSVSLCDTMARAGFFQKMPLQCSLFPTVHDAIQFCTNNY